MRAPTLLIVGSRDDVVIDLNRKAQRLMTECDTSSSSSKEATHLFEEPGTLAEAASHAELVRAAPAELSGIRRQWS